MAGLGDVFKNALEVVKLKDDAIGKVAKDESATGMTVVLVAVVSLVVAVIGYFMSMFVLGALGSAFGLPGLGAAAGMGIIQVVFAPIGAIIGLFIMTGIFFLSCLVLGGKGKYMEMFRPLGHAYVLQLISWIPIVSFVVAIWNIVVMVKVFKVVHQFTTGRAFVAWLIPVLVLMVFAIVLVVIMGAAFFGTLASMGGTEALSGLATYMR